MDRLYSSLNADTGHVLKSAKARLDCRSPQIMGILNLTPDSFYDGGQWVSPPKAYAHAEEMVALGANLIDVGAESSRPGATPVGLQEELDRLLPILEKICQLPVWVSIDTCKLEVMKYAHQVGVKLFNNIDGFSSPEALQWAADQEVAICMMHKYGTPQTMAKELFKPKEGDVVLALKNFFKERFQAALEKGIGRSQIIFDPGFGFGKSLEDNYRLLAHLPEIIPSSCLALVGLSNKRMLQSLLPAGSEEARKKELMTAANTSSTLFSVLNGANIVRVHDVRTARIALNFYQQIRAERSGSDL